MIDKSKASKVISTCPSHAINPAKEAIVIPRREVSGIEVEVAARSANALAGTNSIFKFYCIFNA